MASGVDCFAITDHNSGGWIDELKQTLEALDEEEPEGYRPIHLFPGVEISVNGNVHVLAIFDPSCTTDTVSSLLGSVGYSGQRGVSDTCTTKSFVDVMSEIVGCGAVAIPAHVDRPKGMFEEVSGQTLEQCLTAPGIAAMELCELAYAKPGLFTSAGTNWAEVVGSDAHMPQDIGRSCTWVKMGTPDIEGLKLALTDGQLSLCRYDPAAPDKNQHASAVIESLAVSETKYCGRGSPLKVQFGPWLNAIIGGRGTGKSTLVELSRICLGREEELLGSVKQAFEEFKRVPRSREDRGVLTDNTHVQLQYRKDGGQFRISWGLSDEAATIEQQEEDGAWVRVEGNIVRRFPVRMYSQKQIFEMASGPESLLYVIDDSPEVDKSRWIERWNNEESQYLTLCSQARGLKAALAEEGPLRGELNDVQRTLKVFEDAGHSDVLTNYKESQRQVALVADYARRIRTLPRTITETAKGIIPPPFDDSDGESRSDNMAELEASTGRLREQMATVNTEILPLADRAREAVQAWRESVRQSSWRAESRRAKASYDALVESLSEQGVGRPKEHARLVKRRQQLESQITAFAQKRTQLDDTQANIRRSLGQLQLLRQQLTQGRRTFLDSVLGNNPFVRIEVVPYGNRSTVEDQFRRIIAKEGSEFQNDIRSEDASGGVLGRLYADYPSDSVSDRVFEERLVSLKEDLLNEARGVPTLDTVRDQRFISHLQRLMTDSPEVYDRLMPWAPEDSLKVSYCSRTGERFRPIEQGSPGQKTAAILAFLLAHGEEPMILDQPEDDLDNHLIYNLVVQQLRQNKLRRQIIVVTHNPNIVVNGDAEFVLVLDVANGQTKIKPQGGLQEERVRKAICEVMEGGQEAFERRYRRIMARVT